MDNLGDIYAIERVARVVVLSNAPRQEEAANVLSVGVLGYCHAYSSSKVLVQVRSVVVNGSVWVGSEMLQYLIATSRKIVSESSQTIVLCSS